MKPIIVDINDISDSTEVYNTRPNPFFAYFIYLVCSIVVIAFCWMYFFKIDIVVKSNGVFRYDDKIVDVSSSVTGKIAECNFEEGQFVNEGDVLLTMKVDSIEESLASCESQLEDVNERIAIMQAYQKDIENENSELDKFKNNKYYNEFVNRRELILASIANSDNNITGQKKVYQKNSEDINESISEYEIRIEKLKMAEEYIRRRKNKFASEESYYYSIVKSYISNYDVTKLQYTTQIDTLEKELEKLENKYKTTKDNSIKNELKNEISSQKKQIKSLKKECEKVLSNLELQQISTIEQQINTFETTILSLRSSVNSSEAQIEGLEGTDSETAENITIMTEKDKVSAELLTYKNQKTEIQNNIESLKNQSEKCILKASTSGYVSQNIELMQGGYVQEGTAICRILPEEENQYYAEIYVENQDIAKIKKDQKVKFEMAAYPSSEYGYCIGEIDTISKDIKVDENSGMAYYLVKVKCDKTTVQNDEGDQGKIINGMACQAKIVVEKKSVLRYILEKIDLLD